MVRPGLSPLRPPGDSDVYRGGRRRLGTGGVKLLQLGLSLIPVAIIVIALIGWVVTLRGNIDAAIGSIEELQRSQYDDTDLVERVQELDIEMADKVADVTTRQAVVENEMRQIMSDHEGFADVLYELGESGLIERREYGNYK